MSAIPFLVDGLNSPDDTYDDVVRLTLVEEIYFATKSGPLGKLNSDLASTYGQYMAHSARGGADHFQPSNSLVQVSDNFVQIKATASGDTAELLADLQALGLQGGVASGYRVSGRAPLEVLDEMAELQSLQFASAALRPWTNVGVTDSQGDVAMNADDARALFGVDGSGVTVGVLSDGFDTSGIGSYATDQASGDLPAGVNVLADYPGSTDEGRGMMQLIHDVAPGADLAFHTAYSEEIDFANGILALAAAGSDVIVDDVIYFAEPMFQDGIIAQAVNTVEAGGVSYFSSAGNQARYSYESAFVDSGESLRVNNQPRGTLHDFDPTSGVDVMQGIYIPYFSTIYIAFQWDEPSYSVSGAPGSANDLDIYIADEAGTVVYAQSITRNNGGDPVEILQFSNSVDLFGQFNLMIANYGGPDPGLMKYVIFDGGPNPSSLNEYDTASGTLYGHANAGGAEAVGAAFYGDTPAYGQTPPLRESFSSAGGTPILFDTAGVRLASPEIRQKPEIVAPDGTNTSFFPAGNDTDGDGFPNFYGTSAAAPHAAAVAALMLELSPGLPPAQVYSALETTAIDMDTLGFDNNTGYGLIQADLALAAVPSGPRLSVSIADESISENGGATTATITRWSADTSISLNVTLTSDDTSEATVPTDVTIAAGDTWASFAIQGVDDSLMDGTQTVTVTASAAGFDQATDTLQITDDEPQMISRWADTMIDFSSQWNDPFNPGAWQAIQALGPPDTFAYGDIETAWEASTANGGGGVEYLTLGYTTPVYATGATVRETFGNGFVTRIDVRQAGTSTLYPVWTGSDPSLPGSPVEFDISWPATGFYVDAVKVTINSLHNSDPSGGGWEAVDAVRLDGWDQPPPPTVTIVATDASAAENPLDGGLFTISRTDTNGDLSVFYTIDPSGTADSSDYFESLGGSVSIVDGQSSATIAITPVDDTEVEGDETLTLALDAGAGYMVGSPDNATITIADNDPVTPDAYAVAEDTVSGSVTSGSYLDTYTSDDVYEEITERHSTGKPTNRRSFLEHKWTFDVTGGDSVTFYVEAVRTDSGEGDEFVFAYSTDDANYSDMLTVTKTIDDDGYQTFVLPADTSGTVYVRVTDTDQTPGNNVLDTIFIDEMFIRSSTIVNHSLAGTVAYYGGGDVPGVTLDLVGVGPHQTSSGSDGTYFLDDLPPGAYILTPSKSDDVQEITAYDASLVLQAFAGSRIFSSNETIAADVDRLGGVTALDASYILQKSVDLIAVPFPGAGRVWDFVPNQRTYANLNADLSGQDFTAILLGDPSANWATAPAPLASGASITIPVVESGQSQRVVLPVEIQRSGATINSADLVFNYDAAELSLVDVQFDSAATGLSTALNTVTAGEVLIGLASGSPFAQDGTLVNLTFDVLGSLATSTAVTLVSAKLDEGGVAVTTQNGAVADTIAPVVTVDALTTTDTTPPLTGTVDDNMATVQVTVEGMMYPATNNGDGSWTLADDTLNPLSPGTHDVVVAATDPAGNVSPDSTTQITVQVNNPIPGDANRDGTVGAADGTIVAANWQMQSGATWAHGDFNNDQRVNDIDATLMAANWGQTLPPATAMATPSFSTTELEVSYDLDNDGQIGLGDLALFASVYREQPGITTESPYAYAADFDRSGTVDLGDLAFFAANYRLSRSDSSAAPMAAFTVDAPAAILPGDANRDGAVDDADATALALNWQKQTTATWAEGDFNDDGLVDDFDAAILALHWRMTVEDLDDDDARDSFFATIGATDDALGFSLRAGVVEPR